MKRKEWQEQAAFVEWFRLKYPTLTIFHIPNGEMRDKGTAIKLKKMGVLDGVPDLNVLELHLFIEMKLPDQRLTKSQEEFKEKAIKSRHSYITAHSFEDAKKQFERIIKYMSF